MDNRNERVLLIESDPKISQLIAEQTLQPLGYHVDVVESAPSVLQEVQQLAPDVIITNLNLPGLSGKDLLVALESQGIHTPVIVMANKGQETDILQSFRLGAVDFLITPIRETEVINALEKTLSKLRERIDLEIFSHQLDQTKAAMTQQLHDFSEIFSISKLLLSTVDLQLLYEKIANVSIQVGEADYAWILTLDAKQNKYILQTCQNLPEEMQSRFNLPYEDELSSLVAVSGQVVSIHGEALKRVNNLESMESALLVPVKHYDKVSAIIVLTRKTPQPFNASQQAMLELVAEFGSILYENSQRFHLMEQRLIYLKQSSIYATIESNLKYDLLCQASSELRSPLKLLMEKVDLLLNKDDRKLNREQLIILNDIQEEAEILFDIADSLVRIHQGETSRLLEQIDLNEIARNVINRFQPIAQLCQIIIKLELPSQPTNVKVYSSQITKVIEGLLSNALKYSPPNGVVTIHIDQKDDYAIMMMEDQGDMIDERLAERIFDKNSRIFGYSAKRFGGLGISLPMIKEIISAYKGRIWIEKKEGRGFTIIFSLPRI